MLCLDNNVTLWKKEEQKWLKDIFRNMYKDYSMLELQQQCIRVEQCTVTLIQSTPTQDESDRLMKIAINSEGKINGMVGWYDIADSNEEALLALQERYKKSIISVEHRPLLIGLCPMIDDLQEEWLISREVRPLIKYMIERNLIFEARVKPQHLEHIYKFLKAYPKLRAILDFIGRPNTEDRLKQWKSDIKAIASVSKNVVCKLSGIYSETLKQSNRNAKFGEIFYKVSPLIRHLVKTFGAKRTMWASDWPSASLTQQEWNDFLKDCFKGLKTSQIFDIFFVNSSLFYGEKYNS
ncbi:hydrolase [Heterostelium album PN500]|uniref:Hydrolase n=1 Tax=Heterostelium pallidum (strain ATCC 26659 / Pp 5 / PN500) TaxID=670386 RepID=D3BCB1_HETP5|nr:hydrolase [Heterostelium album PN500]EFA80901.1 hydrolase [Heterostelium album PN500]|eukprot:XP_020433019.1 hydrolase [Heterostelium album PN500]